MFGFGGSGSYSKSKGKSKSKSDFWTASQKAAEKSLGEYFKTYQPGQGATPYSGQLAGTYTSPILSRLFSGAGSLRGGGGISVGQQPTTGMVGNAIGYDVGGQSQLFAKDAAGKEGVGGVDPMFAHYDYFANPEERTQARLEEYRKLVAPEREKEDALMKAKMKSMGLQHSTDMLKSQADTMQQRQSEEALMGMEMLDRYEQLGFEANEAALNRLTGLGQLQTDISNAGLDAQFQEWMRTQPEYNPMIEQIMQYLGLQGQEKTKGSTSATSWNVRGSAQYGSAQ